MKSWYLAAFSSCSGTCYLPPVNESGAFLQAGYLLANHMRVIFVPVDLGCKQVNNPTCDKCSGGEEEEATRGQSEEVTLKLRPQGWERVGQARRGESWTGRRSTTCAGPAAGQGSPECGNPREGRRAFGLSWGPSSPRAARLLQKEPSLSGGRHGDASGTLGRGVTGLPMD